MVNSPQSISINIRAKSRQRDLIDQAAERVGRSRSEFMMEASCRAAEEVLLDQTFFTVDGKSFHAMRALLDAPPRPSAGLRRTMSAKAPWDKRR